MTVMNSLHGHGNQVFLSYGRADALEFAKRLAADLQTCGHRPWMDVENIESGGVFDVRIEQGIRTAGVVLAVMTPASVREQSVCRDEVVFALNVGKSIVPLKAHPDVRPTLLLARRNWVDFTAGYDEGLARLLRYLAGDESALVSPRFATVTGVAPFDFGPEIAWFSAGFTGREWLVPEIDAWLASSRARAIVIVGDRGIGKSAIAAWLAQRRPDVVGVHFCTHRNTRTLDPYEFVAALVGQLHTRLPSFAEQVEARIPESRRRTAADAFRELVVEPALELDQRGAAPLQPQLVILDSLDEAVTRAGETAVDVLVEHANSLPPWLRIVTTTQPESRVLDRIRTLHVLELPADRAENRIDLRAYLDARLQTRPLADRVPQPQSTADRLDALAAGNFLYVKTVLDALEDGSLAVADLGSLAPGLADYYDKAFRRRFPDIASFSRTYAPLLRALTVAEEPMPFAVLQRLAHAEPEDLNRRLRDLRSYLRASRNGPIAVFALYHQSLRDWLTTPDKGGDYWCDPVEGNARLAEVLLPRWQDEDYALRHVVTHLVAAGQTDAAVDLCRCDGAAYLREAIRHAGLRWVENQLQRVFVSSLASRRWHGAATAQIFLRWIHTVGHPVVRVLELLLDPTTDDTLAAPLTDLERIPNHSLQLAIAVLAAARCHDLGRPTASDSLFRWMSQHPSARQISGDTPAAQAFNAVLLSAPLELAEKLVSLQIFENANQQFRVLTTLWGRAPQGTLRHPLLEALSHNGGDLHQEQETVESIARQAVDAGDGELCLAVFRWLGNCSAEVGIELLSLTKLADRLANLISEAVRLLRGNPRLQRYRSIRAGVCAFILMGRKLGDRTFSQLAEDLAQVADVDLTEISYSLAGHCAFATELWKMSPAEFCQWLSVRLPFLTQVSARSGEEMPKAEHVEIALRQFVSQMSTVLRWVAAQSDNRPEDKAAVQSCFQQLSSLAWKNIHAGQPPLLDEQGKRGCLLEDLDIRYVPLPA